MLTSFITPDSESAARRLAAVSGVRVRNHHTPERILYPDEDCPVFRRSDSDIEAADMRWGFPPKSLTNQTGWNPPLTIVHRFKDRWWREMNREYLVEAAYRCLVPFACMCLHRGRHLKWFEPARPGFFAAFWRPWEGDTRLVALPGDQNRQRVFSRLDLFAVASRRPEGASNMRTAGTVPVILSEPDHIVSWLQGGEETLAEALERSFALKEMPAPAGLSERIS